MSRLRNWCFTLNNYTEADYAAIKTVQCRYMVIGKEEGKEGTPHLQGYIEFTKGIRFNRAKTILCGRAHIEGRKGTPKEAADYCKKEGDWWEKGEMAHPGTRTDLSIIHDLVEGGHGIRAICQEVNLNYQSLSFACKLMTYIEPAKDWKPEVMWYYGGTGAGKSRSARLESGDDMWPSNADGQWYDGYDGHADVILEDFRACWCRFSVLLRLLDWYGYRVPYKGGFRQWRPRRIWITTRVAPHKLYKTREDISQLIRRIDVIKYFDVEEAEPILVGSTIEALREYDGDERLDIEHVE